MAGVVASGMIALRPYQLAAVESARRAIAGRKRRLILLAPTAAGKTVIASGIIESAVSRGKTVLFLAHRKELIQQASAQIDAFGIDHGIIMSNHWRRRPGLQVQVASVQTLAQRALPPADLVIIDEAHLSLAKTYTDLIAAYSDAVILGLTATPLRADGKPLGAVYQEIIPVSSVQQLMRMGFLVRPRHFAPSRPDLTKIGHKGGDYDEGQLSDAMDKPDLIGNIVDHWRSAALGRTTAVFAVRIQHSKNIVAQFIAAGVRAEHVDGTTPARLRDQILSRFASGETTVVSNVGVFTEGYDNPRISAIVLARPTESLTLYLQMGGRGLRIHPESGKQDCIILDHAGCAHAHGFVDEDREWSLDGKKKRGAVKREQPVRTCDKCFAAYHAALRVCPECGYAPPVEDHEISTDETAALVEVTDAMRLEMAKAKRREAAKAKTLEDLIALGKLRGYKPSWAYMRHRARQKRHG